MALSLWPLFMAGANEIHVFPRLMFCGPRGLFNWMGFGIVMANIYQKKGDIPYKFRVLKIEIESASEREREKERKTKPRKYSLVCSRAKE